MNYHFRYFRNLKYLNLSICNLHMLFVQEFKYGIGFTLATPSSSPYLCVCVWFYLFFSLYILNVYTCILHWWNRHRIIEQLCRGINWILYCWVREEELAIMFNILMYNFVQSNRTLDIDKYDKQTCVLMQWYSVRRVWKLLKLF